MASTPRRKRALSAEMRAVEDEFPGWRLWLTDAGNIAAVTVDCPSGGMTVFAPTPDLARHEIAKALWDAGMARETWGTDPAGRYLLTRDGRRLPLPGAAA